MKKILSLILVVVMLASLAISAAAATITNPFKADSNDVMFESWLDYYMWYYLTGGNADIKVDDATPVWYDQCPRCGNVAMFFEKDSKIIWTCLNKECNQVGFYPVVEPDNTTSTIHTATCNTCKKSENVIYLTTKVTDGKYISTFFCKTCHKLFDKELKLDSCKPGYVWCGNCHKPGCTECHNYWYCSVCRPGCSLPGDDVIDPGFTYPDYPNYNPGYVVKYNCFACDKELELQYYSNINGTYYGYYKCETGHIYTLPYYGTGIYDPNYTPVPEGYYAVKVNCGTGGTYQLSDKPYGKIGDRKLLTIVPEAGYVVSNVTINGESWGAAERLLFEVKGTTLIKITFKKVGTTGSTTTTPTTPTTPSTTGQFIINATTNGKGTIEAYKNGVKVENSTIIGANKNNTVVLKFVPASSNYYVSDVRIDGVSIGAVKTYTFSKISESHTVTVEYKWKSPFSYIAPNYAKAVEYVTEAGIIAPTKVVGKTAYFSGTNVVSVKAFASALAEMADVKGVLNTDAERANWALKNGLILATDDETAPCNIQIACRMVTTYLAYIETLNNVDFVDFDASASAKDNALSLGLATEAGYTGNRNLTRYDLAAVCYMIKTQNYSMK